MTTKQPSVPPANRSPKGPGSNPASGGKITREDAARANRPDNTEEQGAPGNISQNTHNQGYQQDR
jgi:hypothetical protein